MDLTIYQILVPLLSLFIIIRSFVHFRKGRHGLMIFIFWLLTGLGISGIAFFPDQISFPIAEWLGIKSNVNAIIFLGLGVLLVNNYLLTQKVQRLDANLKEVIRRYAKDMARLAEGKAE